MRTSELPILLSHSLLTKQQRTRSVESECLISGSYETKVVDTATISNDEGVAVKIVNFEPKEGRETFAASRKDL